MQAARATPKGSLRMLCAAPVHENTGFCGQRVSKSTSVHEIVDSGGQDAKQPEFYVEPEFGPCFGTPYTKSGLQISVSHFSAEREG